MLTYYEAHIHKAVTICQGVALGLSKNTEQIEITPEKSKFSIFSLLVIPDPAPSFQKIVYHNQSSYTAFSTKRAVDCITVVNRMVYTTMAIIGILFVVIYIIVAFSIKRFGKKTVFCEYYLNIILKLVLLFFN